MMTYWGVEVQFHSFIYLRTITASGPGSFITEFPVGRKLCAPQFRSELCDEKNNVRHEPSVAQYVA
jgi:hypothetical protein